MLKIGIDARVFSKPRPDGTSRYLSCILNHLIPLDKSIKYFLLSNRPILSNQHHIPNLENLILVQDKSILPGTVWFFLKTGLWINKMKLDYFWAPYPTIPFIRSSKTKYIITIHDLTFLRFPNFLSHINVVLSKSLFPYSVKRADIILSVSKFTSNEIRRYICISNKPIYLTYPCLLSIFGESYKPINDGPKFTILFVGTFEPRKNLHFLLNNFIAIRNKISPDIRLVLAGRMGWNFKFEHPLEFYKAHNINIIFSPSDDRISALYREALVFVLPSHYEGFGIPVLEAMSFRVAVLCTNSSSLPEVGGDAAEYFAPSDSDDFKSKLLKLVNDPLARQKLICRQPNNLKRFNPKDSAISIHKAITGDL